MRKQFYLLSFFSFFYFGSIAQSLKSDSVRVANLKTLQDKFKTDSAKIEKEYSENQKWEKLAATAQFPLLNAGENSGVAQVPNVSEIPDPTIDYKLLFDFIENNPDSLSGELNAGLVEISRRLNLHAAAGIPAKRILPVIVIHAGALNAVKSNAAYKKRYQKENPNVKLFEQMKQLGVKFIVCGQSMQFTGTSKDDLLPGIAISVSAQSALSMYQLKGYVLFKIW
jgi:intracellular sulfur oxidation DsrE/DsrF family protein